MNEERMLPQARLRKFWLWYALRNYPLYDPPHKIEEYRLPREKAVDNFDHFMRVRQQRAVHFKEWLRRYFRVGITPDESGVKALNRWGNKYAGLLLAARPDGHPSDSYLTYDPPWTGDNAGCNVLFDMGITLGEIIIVQCPKLHWDLDPVSAVLPRTAKMLKGSPGMSFQRPKLTGFDDPVGEASPLHQVNTFARQMFRNMTTFKGFKRYLGRPRRLRSFVRDELLNSFNAVLRYYPAGVLHELRQRMPLKDYLAAIDDVESKDGDSQDH